MNFYSIRKIFALIIILGGIGISLTLINHGPVKNGDFFGFVTRPGSNPSLNYKNSASVSAEFSNQNPSSDETKTDNMTDALINGYIREFAVLNQNGPQTINGKTGIKPISEETFQGLIESKVNEDISFENFSEKDIKISEDNSLEAQSDYLKSFGAITQKNFGNFKTPITDIINKAIEKQKTDDLERYLNIAANQINDLLALQTPARWRAFHLQNLNLWQKKLTVYAAILNYKDDPLKGVIALKQVESLIDESENIQTVLENRIKELNS